jgi:Flp pilus assembly protein protease CpaA
MGDVKLMAAVGAFLRWPMALWTLAFVLLSGSVVAFVYAMRIGKVKAVFNNMWTGMTRLVSKQAEKTPIRLHHMPYAVAILIGVTVSVIYRYAPLLQNQN